MNGMNFFHSSNRRDLIKLKNLLLITGIFVFGSINSQTVNYVSNGGFERYKSCVGPNTGYITSIYDWDEIDHVTTIAKWNHPCYGAVPYNGFYYNYPRTDSAYLSFDVVVRSEEHTSELQSRF